MSWALTFMTVIHYPGMDPRNRSGFKKINEAEQMKFAKLSFNQ